MEKAIIFDLDGTLIDSVHDIADCLNDTLLRFNFKEVTTEKVKSIIGNGAKKLIIDAIDMPLPDEKVEEILVYYNKIYTASTSPKTIVFSGMKEVLKKLKSLGYKLAVLTNKPQATTEKVCEIYLNDIGFDIVYGQLTGRPRKPDKTSTLEIIDKLGVLKKNVIFVGDGDADFLTAKNAGINSVSVLWGYRTKEQLSRLGATNFVNTPSELFQFLVNN